MGRPSGREYLRFAGPGSRRRDSLSDGYRRSQRLADGRRSGVRGRRLMVRFAPEGRPELIACCAPARRPGWLVPFRQSGRAFYAYVYATTAQAKRDAFTALSSLLVERR